MIAIQGKLHCDNIKFSHASKDFLMSPEVLEVNKLKALRKKRLLLLLDATNFHDYFDNSFKVHVQERGELPDYLKFHSRPISLEFGQHHILELQVSKFVETERYSNLDRHQKECTSESIPGSKR